MTLGLVLDHSTADNVTGPQEIECVVDLLKTNGLDRVPDLTLLDEGNDLAQIVVIAPERAVKGVFAGNEGKQGDVDPVPDKADGRVVRADG